MTKLLKNISIIVLFISLVDLAATIQYTQVLKIPIKPVMYIVPSLVGFTYGILLIFIILFYKRNKKMKAYEFLALNDTLTKALNRYACNLILEVEFKKYLRHSKNFSLIMIDLDDFKNINDNHGHLAGDQVLICLINILRERLRKSDSICRWGGEEFIIILPETSIKDACSLANELKKLICNFTFDKVGNVTVSMGVSSTEKGYKNIEEFINDIDKLLYKAKKTGKNKVICKK